MSGMSVSDGMVEGVSGGSDVAAGDILAVDMLYR